MTTDVVVVPSTLALLPGYASAVDPVADLRAACDDAVLWLMDRHPDRVTVVTAEARADNVARGVTEPAGARVGRHLLAGFGGRVEVVAGAPSSSEPGLLVVANGSAVRDAKAPGHLDERSFAFDAVIEAALRSGDAEALRGLDAELGASLWAHDVPALQALGASVRGPVDAVVTYADDPYGVQYWVARWTCES
jgi:hypothetical protein